jgi:KDEL-tailed cysteine endopeptidase
LVSENRLKNSDKIFDFHKFPRRRRGVISAVQKQNSCGDCFAIAVVGEVEAMAAIKTNKLTLLSVQQMLDCNGYHMDCSGGNPCGLSNWLLTTQTRLQTTEEYANTSKFSTKCTTKSEDTPGLKIEDYSCNECVLISPQ